MPGPAGDHLGDRLRVDADLHQRASRPGARAARPSWRRARPGAWRLGAGVGRRAVAGLRPRGVLLLDLVARARGSRSTMRPLLLPARLELGEPGLGLRRAPRVVSASRSSWRAPVARLAFEDAELDLEVVDLPAAVLDGRRDRALADRHPGAGGVEQADRLVGELPAGDVAVPRA